MKKRFLNLILALVMIACVLPMAAFATEYAADTCESFTGEHDWLDGYCGWCALPCKHNYDSEGECTKCDVVCLHPSYNTDGKCTVCAAVCKHTYVNKGYKEGYEPTCQKTGLSILECSACGYRTTQTAPVVKCIGKYVPEVKATCTTAGKKSGRSCKYCGKVMTGQAKIAALGHSFELETEVKAPTCTEKGMERYRCETCGAAEIRYPAALGHQPYNKEAIEPTCSEVGRTAGKQCGRCKEILEGMEEVPVVSHTPGKMIRYIKHPTCQETGEAEYECTECDGSVVQVIRKKVCNITELPAVEPTCNNQGKTAGTKCDSCNNGESCAYCKENLKAQTDVAALGHDQVLAETTREATCTKDGEGVYNCSRCGYDGVKKVLPALGHVEVVDIMREATCTKIGWKEVTCSREGCGKLVVQKIEATGHTEEVVPEVPATCTDTGLSEGLKCSVCDETLVAQTVTSMVAHVFETPVAAKPVTCTEDGYTAHMKCNNCSATQNKEEIDTDGHIFENYVCKVCGVRDGSCDHKGASVTIQNPTCTEDGKKSFKCATCGDSHEEVLEATGHTEEVRTVAGNCVTSGKQWTVCTVCNQITVPEKDLGLGGHNVENGVCTICEKMTCKHTATTQRITPPTCTKDGSRSVICAECGTVVDVDPLPANGHNHVNGVFTECGHQDSNRITIDLQDVFLTGED